MDKELLSASDLAKMLSTTERTVRKWRVEGRLPAPRKIGTSVRWSRAEILAWIKKGCPGQNEKGENNESAEANSEAKL